MSLSALPPRELAQRLRGAGLRLQTGPLVFCIRSRIDEVHQGLIALYGDHTVLDPGSFADFDVSVDRAGGLRRWLRPQLYFGVDGSSPFAPLPGNQGLPMLEWGMNWCVSGSCHQYLVLHAAVLERNGRALVMPAPSGSGKSTLCAALLFHGWRLLSDELALIDPATGHLQPMPRAVSLKNASIEVLKAFVGPALQFGSVVHDTVKGRVGHFAPPRPSVLRAHETVLPAWIVFPRFEAGASAVMTRLSRGQALMRLIENAFNYNVHAAAGFQTLADLVQASHCAQYRYSDLEQAVRDFEQLAQTAPGATP